MLNSGPQGNLYNNVIPLVCKSNARHLRKRSRPRTEVLICRDSARFRLIQTDDG